MALRVLLADESVSIKKVMQLALQDFGVEVKSVGNGADVLPVARSFNPDIVFVDVLLSKRSGYDVCEELKNSTEFASVPVILMWSGFMEIDAQKAQSAKSSAQLEKPFDADSLRNLVKKLVPKIGENKIAEFLTHAPLPDFVDEPAQNDFEEPEEFQQVPLPKMGSNENVPFEASAVAPTETESESEGWAHQDLSKYRIETPNLDEPVVEEPLPVLQNEVRAPQSSLTFSQVNPPPAVDIQPQLVELILREKAPEVLQDMAWKMMPEIIERVVREELQKLLKQAEKFE